MCLDTPKGVSQNMFFDIQINTSETEAIQAGQNCDVQPDCKACGKCCEKGSGYVLKEDIPKIAQFLNKTETEIKEGYLDEVWLFNKQLWKLKLQTYPVGPCIFYKEGCTINEAKPLH